eukprot:14984564-Heterocapsa_arctica.AAC.1
MRPVLLRDGQRREELLVERLLLQKGLLDLVLGGLVQHREQPRGVGDEVRCQGLRGFLGLGLARKGEDRIATGDL